MEDRMEKLSFNLDRFSEVPLYEQLYQYIKQEIIEGRIEYGCKLPSKRKLSEFLKISQNTIETAYEQLIAEGYVESIPRKGFYVLAHENLEYIKKEDSIVIQEEKKEKRRIQYDFHPNWIDTEHFPFNKWRKYAKNIIDKQNHSLLLLGDQQGEYELRKEIANYLYQARGVRCTPNEIILGAGIEILLQQLIFLLDKKTIYGVEDPGYHVIWKILKNFTYRVDSIPVDEDGVRVDEIENLNLDVVYITPSRQFPSGSVLSVNRRIKLLNWASAKENRYIMEDDYDSEFRYSGKLIPSLKSIDQGEKVIYLGNFSKYLIPSIRISYMVLPKHLMKKYKKELSFYSCSVSRIDQHILAQFMKEGDFERHLNKMRKIYRRKLEILLQVLKPYQEKISIMGENAGFYIIVSVKNGMNEQELVEKAFRAKIKVYPLSDYSIQKREENPPKIILGFGGISEKELPKAISSLLKKWEIH